MRKNPIKTTLEKNARDKSDIVMKMLPDSKVNITRRKNNNEIKKAQVTYFISANIFLAAPIEVVCIFKPNSNILLRC